MKTFAERFSKDISKVVSWHKDVKGRRKFLAIFWSTYAIILLFLIAASVMFTLAGLKFDDTAVGPPWVLDINDSRSMGLFVGGIVLYIIAIGLGLFFAIYYPGLFKESQAIYLTSQQYRIQKILYLRTDLTRLDKKYLKWLYKLKYIDKSHYKTALEAKKKKSKK